MSSEPITEFHSQLQQLRDGNAVAIERFVKQYEPYIRRTLRFRITQASLNAAADSVDVCQSVLGSFLLRLSCGEYELHTEDDMRKLLSGIVHKKFLMLSRHENAAKRDRARTLSLDMYPKLEIVDNHGVDPSTTVILADLKDAIEQELSEQELKLLKLRKSGRTWSEIGDELGEDQVVLRKRLSRAINRVSQKLGLLVDDD